MRVPTFCIEVSWLTLISYSMFICCLQVQSGVYLAYWEDLLPGHRAALEEQVPWGEGCMHPSLQDTEHGCRVIAS